MKTNEYCYVNICQDKGGTPVTCCFGKYDGGTNLKCTPRKRLSLPVKMRTNDREFFAGMNARKFCEGLGTGWTGSTTTTL